VTGTFHTYSDGGARGNPGPAAIGAVLADEHNKIIEELGRCIGETTNNKAEYNAMLLALELAKKHRAKRLVCFGDSELIIFQLQGRYRIKDLTLRGLAEKVKSLASEFESITFRQVPREHPMIRRADKLVNQALDRVGAKAPFRPPAAPPGGQQEFF